MKQRQHSSDREWNLTQKVQQTTDFTGRVLYVGIDVHKVRWQVAVYYDGLILSNTSIEGTSEGLITHLRKRYGDAQFSCVYESGAFGFSLCRCLWAAGMQCMVVNPADIPDTDKERRSKTDGVDARKLATHLAAGLLHPIHVPTEKLQKQRSLIRFRKKLWGDLCRAKNRLKSELRFQGITIPRQFDNPHWSRNFLAWIEEQAKRDQDLQATLLLMLEEAKLLRALLLKTERSLREMMWSDEYKQKSELLRSIPGVGSLTAMLFLLEIGDVRRFRSIDQLNRFVGFCPDSHSSAERERHTGISRRKHSPLRSMLVEAAWQLVRRDPAMLDHYKSLTKRMKGQQAIIRVARKLLRRIRAVMLSERRYVTGMSDGASAEQLQTPRLLLQAQKTKRTSTIAVATKED